MQEERHGSAPGFQSRPPKEINLKELYRVVKKRFWIVAFTTIVLAAAGGFYDARPELPLYAAGSRLLISAESPEHMSTLKVIVREPVVMSGVAETLGLDRSPAALRGQVNVGSVDNSAVTVISVIDTDPELAAVIANAVVAEFREVARERFGFTGIAVLTEAAPDFAQINPPGSRALVAGGLAGVVIGLALAFFRDSLDDSLKSAEDIEQVLMLTPLGSVPKIGRRDARRGGYKKNVALRGETIGS